MIPDRWENQEEALAFSVSHPQCMLDMEMGTGKTRVAIDTIFARKNIYRVLVVCPKAVVPVWRLNLEKFAPPKAWVCWDHQAGSVKSKAESLKEWLENKMNIANRQIVVMNYDSVWRDPMGALILKSNFQMVILDESHRAKAAGSKVSKFLALFGKRVQYKMCLSGTPMANSPLDVYGQYRFLDNTIFGTNYLRFLDQYAIKGGAEQKFIVGYKNQKELQAKFQSIAYTCKMDDVAARLKLPDKLPPVERQVTLPSKDMKTIEKLAKEFIAECGEGFVVVQNVLVKMIRMQQITSGYCETQENPVAPMVEEELNTSKADSLVDLLEDIPETSSVVVFCVFRHDADVVAGAAAKAKRDIFRLTGDTNELKEWQQSHGGVLAVQIRAGAEGVDMTMAHHAVYFSLPYSLALYEQSKARLYRPSQKHPVSFVHLIAKDTIDEVIYESLIRKKDIIESIKNGTFDRGCLKG